LDIEISYIQAIKFILDFEYRDILYSSSKIHFMTEEEEGLRILRELVEKEISDSGFFGFFKPNLTFEKARKLQPYEKIANLTLPNEIIFDKIKFSSKGINEGEYWLPWNKICATALQIEQKRHESESEPDYYEYSLLICYQNGHLECAYLGEVEHLKGLLGHLLKNISSFILNQKTNKSPYPKSKIQHSFISLFNHFHLKASLNIR
jgi:hypothetical protein